MSLTPQQVIIVGDAHNDIKAAKQMRTKVMLFYPPHHKKFYSINELKSLNPDYIINGLAKITKITQF